MEKNPDVLQLMDELENVVYMCTIEFYSVIRKNEIMWFGGKLMQLEDIILSEVSQA
jgi:hypothetical protein